MHPHPRVCLSIRAKSAHSVNGVCLWFWAGSDWIAFLTPDGVTENRRGLNERSE
jgi:hypothetical protein